jgi:hypothetical protein
LIFFFLLFIYFYCLLNHLLPCINFKDGFEYGTLSFELIPTKNIQV